jgi:hypothetical protein
VCLILRNVFSSLCMLLYEVVCAESATVCEPLADVIYTEIRGGTVDGLHRNCSVASLIDRHLLNEV